MNYPGGIKHKVKNDKSTKINTNYGNRGMTLENELNSSNDYYRLIDKAIIYKKPTPITINKVDYKSRMDGYAVARQNGWMSANDIRQLENLDMIPEEDGGNAYLVNGNMIPLNYALNKKIEEDEKSEEEVLAVERKRNDKQRNKRENNRASPNN